MTKKKDEQSRRANRDTESKGISIVAMTFDSRGSKRISTVSRHFSHTCIISCFERLSFCVP